jgi:hypothetical protein
MTQTSWPASAKQEAFVLKLASERHTTPDQQLEILGGLTGKRASALITELLKAPKLTAAGPMKPLPEPGYYLHQGEVVVVVKAKTSDRVYAQSLVLPPKGSGKQARWAYDKGLVMKIDGPKMTVEEAMEFGKVHEFCAICGKPMTVSIGIGPVCKKKLMGA